MSTEQPPSSEKRGTLLETMDTERMIRLVEQTTSLKLADRLYEAAKDRLALNKSLENQIAVDRIKFLRKTIFKVALLEADFKAPDDEAIAFEEAVNEALFKRFGES